MPRYRKKPKVVDAFQWFKNGDHPEDNRDTFTDPDTGKDFLGEGRVVRYYRIPDMDGQDICKHCSRIMHEHGWIDTLEGGHIVCPGDYVITGIQGEYYPCKPDIFADSYDPVKQDSMDKNFAEAYGKVDEATKLAQKANKDELIYYQKAASMLWQMLDNIDTLDDSCKSDEVAYRKYTRTEVGKRFQIFTSDGQRLFPVTLEGVDPEPVPEW